MMNKIVGSIVLVVLPTLLLAQTKVVSLTDAITIALENNNQLKVSDTAIKIADTQYQQAMSAHYPTLDLDVTAMRMDEDPYFQMRGTATTSAEVAQQQLLGNAQFIDSVDAFQNGGAPGTPTATQVAQGAIAAGQVGGSSYPIAMDVQMMGRDSIVSQLNLTLPLYTGGKITAITKQAKIGKDIAKEDKRRSRNQVVYDVKRYYYGVLLTKQLRSLTEDTLERMRFTRDLTSRLYQGGSMRVKKTDYLRSKLSVNFIDSLHETLLAKETMVKSALINAMGLSWRDEVDITDTSFATPSMDKTMTALVDDAYRFNPDYTTLRLAIDIHGAKIDESKSDYLPSVALMGSLQNIYNDYDYGVVNDTTKNSWSIGVGLRWELFNGGRTMSKVEQSRLEKRKLEQQEVLLQEGLALQVKQAFLQMQSSYRQYAILTEAVETARESRDLNTRAYQEDIVETKDVIESQLFEAFTEGDFFRSQHDHALARATTDYIVGIAIEQQLDR